MIRRSVVTPPAPSLSNHSESLNLHVAFKSGNQKLRESSWLTAQGVSNTTRIVSNRELSWNFWLQIAVRKSKSKNMGNSQSYSRSESKKKQISRKNKIKITPEYRCIEMRPGNER